MRLTENNRAAKQRALPRGMFIVGDDDITISNIPIQLGDDRQVI